MEPNKRTSCQDERLGLGSRRFRTTTRPRNEFRPLVRRMPTPRSRTGGRL